MLQLTPFLDYGKGWNINLPNPEISSLLSTGLGLRFSWRDLVFVRVDYGVPLINRDIPQGERSLQDNGLHFGILVTPIRF